MKTKPNPAGAKLIRGFYRAKHGHKGGSRRPAADKYAEALAWHRMQQEAKRRVGSETW